MVESRRVGAAALLLLPGGLVAFFAFNSGGFYAGPPAYAAVFLSAVAIVRLIFAADPLEGMSWWLKGAAISLALFALLALLSSSWSHAPALALLEFDLPILYLLAMLVCGSMAHTRERLSWVLRALACTIVIVCACGVITRLLPHVWPTTAEVANSRLSFPVTYWNVLGLLAVLGIILCVHFSTDPAEPLAIRALAAASVPLLACTLYFTFSRGSIAVGLLTLVVYCGVARSRNLLSTGLAALPTTVVAVLFAYNADVLATPNPATAAGVIQGRRVFVALVLCVLVAAALRVALFALDTRLARLRFAPALRARAARWAWISVAAGVTIVLIVFHGTISRQYHHFLHPGGAGSSADFRTRLTDPGNNGRVNMWRVAWHAFKAKPLLGQGAGTFANTYAQRRPDNDFVHDAHSLYLETLDELGVLGLIALLTVILGVLARGAVRARGPNRSLYGALFAVLLAWTLHAGVDWDWEMPVVTVLFFALGGFALAADATAAPARSAPAPLTRVQLSIGCVLLAVAPTYVWLSQRPLDRARAAFSAGDCRTASRQAMSSISTLGIRPEPYQVLAFCDVRQGMPILAIAQIEQAVKLDPHNWNYAYSLALMRAAAGLNPRAAARRALALDPRETLTRDAWTLLNHGNPAYWEATGRELTSQFTTLS